MSWLSVVRLLVLASLVPLLAVAMPLVAEAQARGPSGAAVKAFVTRKEQRLATGVGSSPQSVTVSFGIVRFGREYAVGAIHTALQRLEDKGLLVSRMGDPLPIRGGRARRYFRLTAAGAAALEHARTAAQRLWQVSDLGMEPG